MPTAQPANLAIESLVHPSFITKLKRGALAVIFFHEVALKSTALLDPRNVYLVVRSNFQSSDFVSQKPSVLARLERFMLLLEAQLRVHKH